MIGIFVLQVFKKVETLWRNNLILLSITTAKREYIRLKNNNIRYSYLKQCLRFEHAGFRKLRRDISSLPSRFGANKGQVKENGERARGVRDVGSRKIQMKFRASVYGHARFSGWLDDGGEKGATRFGMGCIHSFCTGHKAFSRARRRQRSPELLRRGYCTSGTSYPPHQLPGIFARAFSSEFPRKRELLSQRTVSQLRDNASRLRFKFPDAPYVRKRIYE